MPRMNTILENKHVADMAERQSKIVEAFAPSLDTPLLDHMRALLDTVSTKQEPEVERCSGYVVKIIVKGFATGGGVAYVALALAGSVRSR
jgi:hypothetical protein